MERRAAAVALARGRIGIGVASLLAPAWVGCLMTGRDGSRGGTKLFARMFGARDIGLGLGTIIALDRGAPVRGWLEASALADGSDLAACLLGRDHIPRLSFVGAVGLAAAGAGMNAWLARQLDPPPAAATGHPEAIATGHPPGRARAK